MKKILWLLGLLVMMFFVVSCTPQEGEEEALAGLATATEKSACPSNTGCKAEFDACKAAQACPSAEPCGKEKSTCDKSCNSKQSFQKTLCKAECSAKFSSCTAKVTSCLDTCYDAALKNTVNCPFVEEAKGKLVVAGTNTSSCAQRIVELDGDPAPFKNYVCIGVYKGVPLIEGQSGPTKGQPVALVSIFNNPIEHVCWIRSYPATVRFDRRR